MRISDWSSDVCSSDLALGRLHVDAHPPGQAVLVEGSADMLRIGQVVVERGAAVQRNGRDQRPSHHGEHAVEQAGRGIGGMLVARPRNACIAGVSSDELSVGEGWVSTFRSRGWPDNSK